MNPTIENFARTETKKLLSQCTEPQRTLFKRMYWPGNSAGNLSVNIDEVVDGMPSEKLDWAMQQVQRTLAKRANDGI